MGGGLAQVCGDAISWAMWRKIRLKQKQKMFQNLKIKCSKKKKFYYYYYFYSKRFFCFFFFFFFLLK